MAKHFPADQWRVWFLEFEAGDLTVARFCNSVGVSVQSFYKWRKRLGDCDLDEMPERRDIGEFVPVTLPSPMIAIELPGGVTVRVPNDADSLRPILSVLLNPESAQ